MLELRNQNPVKPYGFKKHSEKLDRLRDYSEGFQIVSDGARLPYLIHYGRTRVGENVYEFKTAVDIKVDVSQEKYDDVEFTTNVGRIPTTGLGNALVGEFNHKFSGKFVTFGTEAQSESDLVYVTRNPEDWLSSEKLKYELKVHATVHTTVQLILRDIPNYTLKPKLSNSEIAETARYIVEEIIQNNYGSQNKTSSPSQLAGHSDEKSDI